MQRFFSLLLFLLSAFTAPAQGRFETLLAEGWKFHRGDVSGAEATDFPDGDWERVCVPHDWAIRGPFARENDLQNVTIVQNLETAASEKTGRTGGLPYVGVGGYRTHFATHAEAERATLVFDGAMSEAHIYINGREAEFWPYGYSTFQVDATPFVRHDGKENVLAVRLENRPQSSRWYSGAGLYRPVHLVEQKKAHIPLWDLKITTPSIQPSQGVARFAVPVEGLGEGTATCCVEICNAQGECVARTEETCTTRPSMTFYPQLAVPNPQCWSPESPALYTAHVKIYHQDQLCDAVTQRFGFRTAEFVPHEGFRLNGTYRKFQGVCLHHDLGPLGAASNVSALRHRLEMLKDLGCDALRTTHNMPDPALVSLCEELGFMLIIEAFDEWDVAKCENGYHRFFHEWAERDLTNMVRQYRNSPAVVLWSIGNEVPTQCSPEGARVAKGLTEICHREDSTRLVTCGMDQVDCVLRNGFAAEVDVPGFNYRAHRYDEAYGRLPQGFVLGAETASTVSSRGIYKFPVRQKKDATYDDHQASSYDVECCAWSNLPEADFHNMESHPWTLGQFVWTGFDYLGEPYPYDTNAWPSHSSLFGLIDLASLPKDRYFLYRAQWNQRDATLHMLPHWTWPGREGETTPVYVYTSWPEAELFVNGVSQGRRKKESVSHLRLIWPDVVYAPGEIRVVSYDAAGTPTDSVITRTASAPHHLEILKASAQPLHAGGEEVAFFTVRVLDERGTLVPDAAHLINIRVEGAASFEAMANGDPTCTESFQHPSMHAFSGALTVVVRAKKKAGRCTLRATSPKLRGAKFRFVVEKQKEGAH